MYIPHIYQKIKYIICIYSTKHGTPSIASSWTNRQPGLRFTSIYFIGLNGRTTSDSSPFLLIKISRLFFLK